MIDATQYGNWGRFLNFSHEPNCIRRPYIDNGLPVIYLFAGKDIKTGTELTWDYDLEVNDCSELLDCFCGGGGSKPKLQCTGTGYMGIN